MFENLINEIKNIIKYGKFNDKDKKLKKHYAKLYNVEFENLKNNSSTSLLQNDVKQQMQHILNRLEIINNLLNFYKIMYYNIDNYINDNIKKYDTKNEIKIFFPDFFENERPFFDLIYSIHTPNSIYYLFNKNEQYFFCDKILICHSKNDNLYNIMYKPNLKFNTSKNYAKKIFNKKFIIN